MGIRASGPTDSESASSLAGFLSEADKKLPLLSRRPSLSEVGCCCTVLNWFRDSVAEKYSKIVVWRTWDVHPDEAHSDPTSYLALTSGVKPHPNLFFSMNQQVGWIQLVLVK